MECAAIVPLLQSAITWFIGHVSQYGPRRCHQRRSISLSENEGRPSLSDNHTPFRTACALRLRIDDEAVLLAVLRGVNREMARPPLSDNERKRSQGAAGVMTLTNSAFNVSRGLPAPKSTGLFRANPSLPLQEKRGRAHDTKRIVIVAHQRGDRFIGIPIYD